MDHAITTKAGIKGLVGAGDKIMLAALPFLVGGLLLNILFPAFFSVGGPPPALAALAIVLLIPGVILWLWSVVLILTRVPRGELITEGPYALVKHPLYTSVGLLVLPCLGLLLDTWLGIVLGLVLYLAARRFGREEDAALSKTFGAAWDDYRQRVLIPWL